MAVSKTRELLIEVARRLFAKLGFDGTTMNDIAVASKKGRRTLYTYFKSKEEVYNAVVESEQDKLCKILWEVVGKDLPADEKLMLYIYTRLEAVKDVVIRNGSLKAEFFRNILIVEKTRVKFDRREIRAISYILQEGVDEGIFEVPNIPLTADILHNAFKGLEVPYIKDSFARRVSSVKMRKQIIFDFIMNGIKKKSENI